MLRSVPDYCFFYIPSRLRSLRASITSAGIRSSESSAVASAAAATSRSTAADWQAANICSIPVRASAAEAAGAGEGRKTVNSFAKYAANRAGQARRLQMGPPDRRVNTFPASGKP